MTLSTPYPPNGLKVAIAYLRARVPSLASSIASTLPELTEASPWPDNVFLTVTEVPGYPADVDVAQRRGSMLRLDWWAARPTSTRVQWGRAGVATEVVRRALDDQPYGQTLDMGADYRDARVQALYLIDEPSRVPDDPSGYARYTSQAVLDWIAA